MKYLVAVLALSTMVGCASQPSTYEDSSTPEQRSIKATGQAATEAARHNNSSHVGSYNTSVYSQKHNLTSIDQYDINNGRYVIYGKDGERDHRAELRLLQADKQHKKSGYGDYASDRMNDEFDYRLKRKIDAEVERFMDKIF